MLNRSVTAYLGGPTYLQLLVSRLYTHGGDPATAMTFIQARLQQEEHPRVRKKLKRRLHDIWINRDLGLIDAAIARYREKLRADPVSVKALVEARVMKTAPRDPEGNPYFIENGEAATSMEFELLELRQ